MNPFLEKNQKLLTYSFIFLIIIPIFGINFLLSFIGNILILIFLVPILLIGIAFISFNSLKSKVKTCNQCGAVTLNSSERCINCGSAFEKIDSQNDDLIDNPSERTIEVSAEEIN